MTDANQQTTPVTAVQDPTLGLLSHAVSVGVGVVAGWLSLHIPGVTFSPDTQLEITSAVVGAVVSGAHYVQARMSAAKKVTK